ncbi:hypothetical protein BU23DRAFT_601038 [Bimuria novae-zelandiae CBS 107.79]|uniref:Uncharacterized protein n=1 Tax=Bimuria novae-zelandiae CBS 107.79 TaxID=1447943 RepID=A0A6A5UYS7_9PLEO|nr:hypothetical protein BU23DRAFT_601038 [Bimuria novae-zelandiae CBS 107.79]
MEDMTYPSPGKSRVYEESVSEPDEVRMARLSSLLSKSEKRPPLLPQQNKNPRRAPIVLKDSPCRHDTRASRLQLSFEDIPRSASPALEDTPSRTLRSIKPSQQLRRAEWRAAAMFQHYQKAMEIRQQQSNVGVDVFPFFALPAELRSSVYFELLVTDDRVLPTWRGPRKATKQQKNMYINILLTCKMCRDEGLKVLYGENVFDFGEICNRPNNFSRRFTNLIGSHNASLIRIVFAEYSAATEELCHADTTRIARPLFNPKPKATLTVTYLRSFLLTFNIFLPDLRLFAISIMPYGHDEATHYLLQLADPVIRNNMLLKIKWLDTKNEPKRVARMAEEICAQESGLIRADYWKDIDGWIGINFSPPSSGREWLTYKGVRGKEGTLRETEKLGEYTGDE